MFKPEALHSLNLEISPKNKLYIYIISLLLAGLSGVALTTVETLSLGGLVLVESHESSGTTDVAGGAEEVNRSIVTDLEVLEDSELGLLSLVGDTLRSGVNLLLTLLTTTTKTEDQVESGLLLNVVVRKSTAILKLLTSEDQTLLVGGDAFLVADLALDSLDGVIRFDLKGDSLTRQRLYENLHFH